MYLYTEFYLLLYFRNMTFFYYYQIRVKAERISQENYRAYWIANCLESTLSLNVSFSTSIAVFLFEWN